jgi:hypothetical protein
MLQARHVIDLVQIEARRPAQHLHIGIPFASNRTLLVER